MQPRVTAILVARNGADYLERTLAALGAQTTRPDAVALVDAGSSDRSQAMLAAANPTCLVVGSKRGTFGSEIAHALHVAVPATGEDDWIWLLSHDSAPHPRALATLLGAVEIAPSVAVAGPKLMRWDVQDTIAHYGETITRLGASVILVENELDQSQYDSQSDLLGVAASGMLVRRSVWTSLGGFDPGLPSVDAALDFCVRVRLAGHRVVGVPRARISTAGGPELFGRTSLSVRATHRLRRGAQLHRRMVYAPSGTLPFHWLSLLPLGILRSILQLVRKHPGTIGGELGTALVTAFSGTIGPARRNIRRTRTLGWSAIAPLRLSPSDAREIRAGRRPYSADGGTGSNGGTGGSSGSTRGSSNDAQPVVRAGFIAGGGGWVVLLAAAIGVLAFSPLIGAVAVSGGGLLPLSATVAELWAHVGYGWHEVGGGFTGASDPFAAVLAVLGTLTFWAPSFSIVLVYLSALPIAALGAWWCATRISQRAWPPAIAALLWALAPPFLSDLTTGHLGAVLAHILLPWLVLAALLAARSWAASAGAALLFAAVAASAPSIVPALIVLLIVWAFARPTGIIRILGIVIPAAALFAPLVFAQLRRGQPLAILADPGAAVVSGHASGIQLALGSPDGTFGGWLSVGARFGIPQLPGVVVLAALLLPFAAVALSAAFLPGTRRTIPALLVALLGFVSAVAATLVAVSSSGSQAVTLWPGAALSLFWLGLTGAVVVALDAFRRVVALPALVIAVASSLAVAPLLLAPITGTSVATRSASALVPAFVVAEAAHNPNLGTLVITPQPNGAISASIQRGQGTTLDDESTIASTSRSLSSKERSVANLATNLVSRSGLDATKALRTAGVGFILLSKGGPGLGSEVHRRAADALDGNRSLAQVGDTSLGLLWREGTRSAAGAPGPDGGVTRDVILGGLGVVFAVTLLLAIPTTRRRRRSAVRGGAGEHAGADQHATLGEDDDA